MKKLTDYQGDEAIELWADLLDPISDILTDAEIKKVTENGTQMEIVKTIMKNHPDSATKILLRIDPTPVDGLNIVMRLLGLIAEIGANPEVAAFFGFAGQATTQEESSGSRTESTKEEKK